jgi:hypothetical protein
LCFPPVRQDKRFGSKKGPGETERCFFFIAGAFGQLHKMPEFVSKIHALPGS